MRADPDSPKVSRTCWTRDCLLMDRRVAGVGLDPRPDIWSVDLQRGTKTRLTFGGPTAAPVWSADGAEVLYAVRHGETYEIWARAASATGDERRVHAVARPSSLPTVGVACRGRRIRSNRRTNPVRRRPAACRAVHRDAHRPSRHSTIWRRRCPLMVRCSRTRPMKADDGRSCWSRWRRSPIPGVQWRRSTAVLVGGWRHTLLRIGRPADGRGNDRGPSDWSDQTRCCASRGEEPAGVHPRGAVLLRRATAPASSSAILTIQWISELRSKLGPPTATSPR